MNIQQDQQAGDACRGEMGPKARVFGAFLHENSREASLSPQAGEVTFFDLMDRQDVARVTVNGCIDALLLAHQTDIATHLLVGRHVPCTLYVVRYCASYVYRHIPMCCMY